jgi:uncharacterized protein (TIGR02147 family)
MISIFQFTEYRKYLQAFYDQKKAGDKDYSFRKMARQCSFSSPNFLIQVIEGKRNLGSVSLKKVIKGLALKKKEGEYFSYLVYFDQAKTTVEKNYYFGLIASFRSRSNVTRLNVDQFQYYSNWYNLVLRELASGKEADIEPAKLAKMVVPEIRPGEAKKSLRLLEELGLLKRSDDGKWEQTAPLLATDRELNSLAVRNFHTRMLEIAKGALERLPVPDREISSMTVKVSPKGYNKIKERIQEFKEELMQIVNGDSDVDQVYQIGFQLFPVSQRETQRSDVKKRVPK